MPILLLLIALFIPKLVLATALSDAASACAAGQFCQVTTMNGLTAALIQSSSAGHSGTILEFCNKGWWDQYRKRMYLFGGGHLSQPGHIVYDDATNTWTSLTLPSSQW